MNRKKIKGEIQIIRKKGKEWGYILFDRSIWSERKELFLKAEDFWEKPPYDPHISFFTKEEVAKIPKDYEFKENIEFILTGEIRMVNPQTWKDVYSCVFEIVECEEAEKIRKDLGFPKFLRDNHEFHITLGIKKSPNK
jgi:hypothetical protein